MLDQVVRKWEPKRSARFVIGLVGIVIAAGLIGGCKSGSSFSSEETKQLQQGPPKEMPPEARKAMEGMGQGDNRAVPPRPKGQPGPGAPFGPGAMPAPR
ncbi:MAG: hypothetical protein HUU17_08230 [Chthonomonadales bacterium]|nr:hypothetical protein [Chthonomonadales bacterium]